MVTIPLSPRQLHEQAEDRLGLRRQELIGVENLDYANRWVDTNGGAVTQIARTLCADDCWKLQLSGEHRCVAQGPTLDG